MIVRIWRGWTTPEKADAYETLLKTEIFPGIFAKKVKGFLGIELLRREDGEEVQFMTVMRFDGMEAVTAFAGADPEAAYIPQPARAILKRFDHRAQHFQSREERKA